MRLGADTFLDHCLEPEVQRIVLLDAPAVLGWEEWREIGARYGLGLIEGLLVAGIESGEIRRQPVRPLAHVFLGALDELAMLVARSEDPAAARAEAGEVVSSLIEALRLEAPPPLESIVMKAGIHPEYVLAHVRCSCGNEFYTRSTKPELHVEICSACHPFYTGKQKLVDTGGRVERFKRRAARSRRG